MTAERDVTNRQTIGQVAQLAAGTITATAATILVSPILTRQFPPEAFGLSGLAATYVALASGLLPLALPAAIIQDSDRSRSLETVAVANRVARYGTVGAALILVAMVGLNIGGYGAFGPWHVVVTVATTALAASVRIHRSLASRSDRFGVVSAATAASGWFRVLSRVIVGFVSASGLALMATAAAASGLRTWMLRRPFAAEIDGATVSRPSIRDNLRHNWRFPSHVLPATVLNQLRLAIILPGITAIYGLEAAGLYVLVGRLLSTPISMITESITDVVHRRSARSTSPADLRRFVGKALLALSGCAGIAILAAYVSWRWGLAGWALGEGWDGVDLLLLALTPGQAARVILQPVSRILVVKERTGAKLVIDAVLLVAMAGVLLVAGQAGWALATLAWAISGVRAFGYLLYGLVLSRSLVASDPVG